ncbi:MAG: DUF222 domain-containing protein [Longimicrobiales bacterium]|nr:DUF222 domain-containing protein [Longimicrobiales bacterium]
MRRCAPSRASKPDNEADLLELARAGTAAHLERVVRGWRWLEARDEAEREETRHRARTFSVAVDLDGSYVVRGRLEPEVGALLTRAIEAAGDALYRRAPEVEPPQRRADAVGLLAERALAAGFGDRSGSGEEDDAPVSGSRAERYQVVLHVGAKPSTRLDLLAAGADLDDGTHLSAETSRRLACDAGLVTIAHATDSSVLDVGRKTRTVPPAVRRALEARDHGCRFPGCGLRFTDAHHIRHWSEGGETKLENLALLCKFHHRKVHEEGFRVDFPEGGRPNFYDPRGRPLPDAPPPLRAGPRSVESMVRENQLRGAHPDRHTSQARWSRDRDVPGAVLSHALGALSAAGSEERAGTTKARLCPAQG